MKKLFDSHLQYILRMKHTLLEEIIIDIQRTWKVLNRGFKKGIGIII